MAHEITRTDGLVLHKSAAWHGLGTIVEEAPTTREALTLAGLDWEVEQWALSATDGVNRAAVTSHVLNIRNDTGHQLGIVGQGWTPFQNSELADFCDQLSAQGGVKVETAGSIRGGEKVWFLLKGESFGVRGKTDDEVFPYILVSNGFDGATALRVTPTTVRVVCSNTLHMVIPKAQKETTANEPGKIAAYSCLHVGTLKARVEEARIAMQQYTERLRDNRSMIDALAARDVNSEATARFFLECYTKHFGSVADRPKTEKEEKARDKAMEAVAGCFKRFESEKHVAGATAWNAFNAYTGWLQHDRGIVWKDPQVRYERKLNANLFGDVADRTVEAFRLAFSLAG